MNKTNNFGLGDSKAIGDKFAADLPRFRTEVKREVAGIFLAKMTENIRTRKTNMLLNNNHLFINSIIGAVYIHIDIWCVPGIKYQINGNIYVNGNLINHFSNESITGPDLGEYYDFNEKYYDFNVLTLRYKDCMLKRSKTTLDDIVNVIKAFINFSDFYSKL